MTRTASTDLKNFFTLADPVPSAMIEKFAGARGKVVSKFLDLNHTSNSTILVSLSIPKFAWKASIEHGRTSEPGTLGESPSCAT